MTQPLCNQYQYNKDNKEAKPPSANDMHEPRTTPHYEQNENDDEASEMLARILNMAHSASEEQDENDDSDGSYWSEDEYAVLKAYYDNEESSDNEEEDAEAILRRYIMDICQPPSQPNTQPAV